MNFKIALSLLCLCGLFAVPANGASLLPTLGNVVDGGPFDGQLDFVRAGITGTATQSSGGVLSNGDTITGLLSFSSVGPDIPSSIGPLGTPGYAALLFSAEVTGASSPVPGFSFGNFQAAGDLGTLLSNVAGVGPTGAFAALLTSETVDFSAVGLGGANSSDVTMTALFDLAAPATFGTQLPGGGNMNVLAEFFLNAQPASLPDGLTFISVGGFDLTFANNADVGNLAVVGGAGAGTHSLGGSNLIQVNPVPEPASLLTLLGCVAGVGAMGRRRRKAAAAA